MPLANGKSLQKKRRFFWEGALLAAVVAGGAVILCLRLFIFQPFSVSSSSMAPTLLAGDLLVLSKISYGFDRYSLPFAMGPIDKRIPAGWRPQRGDVVVFRAPGKNAVDFLKRIVGLPGERVQMTGGALAINEVPVRRERVGGYALDGDAGEQHATLYRETLPNGVTYLTLALRDGGFYANTPRYTVPAGHYFVLGDNRDNSVDSRSQNDVGYVPSENIIGRVQIIYFSSSHRTGVRWDRLFRVIR